MVRNALKALAVMIAAALSLTLSGGLALAESLNPEGINPHAEAPRQKISVERKLAAAEARKKKQAEIAAGKAGQPAPNNTTNQGGSPANPASELINNSK